MKTLKTKITLGYFLCLLYGLSGMEVYASDPEMWIVQLEDRIPNVSPKGHPNNSICYLVRVAGGGGGEQDRLDLYGALAFKVRDGANHVLSGEYRGNQVRPTALQDIIGLNWPYTQQICNFIYMEGEELIIPDGFGGGYFFGGIKEGVLYIDITFDASTQSENDRTLKAEMGFGMDNSQFFRGTVFCGTLKIHIGKPSHGRDKGVK